jgi:hypothetical protein
MINNAVEVIKQFYGEFWKNRAKQQKNNRENVELLIDYGKL